MKGSFLTIIYFILIKYILFQKIVIKMSILVKNDVVKLLVLSDQYNGIIFTLNSSKANCR